MKVGIIGCGFVGSSGPYALPLREDYATQRGLGLTQEVKSRIGDGVRNAGEKIGARGL